MEKLFCWFICYLKFLIFWIQAKQCMFYIDCEVQTQAEKELGFQGQVLLGPNSNIPKSFLMICKLAAANKSLSALEIQ